MRVFPIALNLARISAGEQELRLGEDANGETHRYPVRLIPIHSSHLSYGHSWSWEF